PHTSSGKPTSGSAWTRKAMSPSQSAAATLYSSESLIRTMNAWNHLSVGNVGTRSSSSAGPRISTGYRPAIDRLSTGEDEHDADHIESRLRRDVRDQVAAPFVDRREPEAGEHHQGLEEQRVPPRRLDQVRRAEQHRGDEHP